MADIVWAPQAIADVESIKSFISRDSILYAELTVTRLHEDRPGGRIRIISARRATRAEARAYQEG